MATPMKSIRLKCIECSGGNKKEVSFCPVEKCPLFPYRLGKRPKPAESNLCDDNRKEPP